MTEQPAEENVEETPATDRVARIKELVNELNGEVKRLGGDIAVTYEIIGHSTVSQKASRELLAVHLSRVL